MGFKNIKNIFAPINKIFLLRVSININSSIKSNINLENIDKFLIYGARLVEEKGQLRLLKDINKMKISNPAIKTIIFCGSGNKKRYIIIQKN